jgi:hypothetical protein
MSTALLLAHDAVQQFVQEGGIVAVESLAGKELAACSRREPVGQALHYTVPVGAAAQIARRRNGVVAGSARAATGQVERSLEGSAQTSILRRRV